VSTSLVLARAEPGIIGDSDGVRCFYPDTGGFCES
jgi:hypothetical protein